MPSGMETDSGDNSDDEAEEKGTSHGDHVSDNPTDSGGCDSR